MPNRIIKESICISEDYTNLTLFQRDFFIRLIVTADDYGRYDGRSSVLRGRMYPLELGKVTEKSIDDAIARLATLGLVRCYEVDGRPYLELSGWKAHQQIRAAKSKYPAPNESDIKCNQLISDDINCNQVISNVPVIENRNRESKAEKTHERFTPPSVDDVDKYCKKRGNSVDAETFVSFYESKGWKVGKDPMKDWEAAVRTWEKRECGTVSEQTRRSMKRL